MGTPFGSAFPTVRKESRTCIGINIKLFFKMLKIIFWEWIMNVFILSVIYV